MARLDKYLWSVRLYKTRSQASDACKKGHIFVNEITSKPSKEVKVGDVITVRKHGIRFEYEVLDLLEKRVGAKLVENFMKEVTPLEELERFKMIQLAQKEYRAKGEGRPTKRDRREIDDWLDW